MSLFDKLKGFQSEKLKVEKEKGAAFLEENKKIENIIETENGIQYHILQEGDGPKPLLQSTIKAHYAGGCRW